MAKHLVQLVVAGAQVVGRAFAKALRQEIAASQQAASRAGGGARGAEHSATNQKLGLSLEEAKQILNVEELNAEQINEKYKHLFEVNDKAKGGSFYIQSKMGLGIRRMMHNSRLFENVSQSLSPNYFLINYQALRGYGTFNWNELLSDENKKNCQERLNDLSTVRVLKIKNENERCGAVLIPLCHVDGELSLLYTVRSSKLKSHRGEISFPGGMKDEEDADIVQTATREMQEEVGLDIDENNIWGVLPPVPSKDGATIRAILGYVGNVDLKSLKLSQDEVESVFVLSLEILCNEKTAQHTQFRSSKMLNGYTMPLYVTSKHRVWGMTAIFTHMALISIAPMKYKKKLRHISPLIKKEKSRV